jgi:hypothetical protein
MSNERRERESARTVRPNLSYRKVYHSHITMLNKVEYQRKRNVPLTEHGWTRLLIPSALSKEEYTSEGSLSGTSLLATTKSLTFVCLHPTPKPFAIVLVVSFCCCCCCAGAAWFLYWRVALVDLSMWIASNESGDSPTTFDPFPARLWHIPRHPPMIQSRNPWVFAFCFHLAVGAAAAVHIAVVDDCPLHLDYYNCYHYQ